MGYAVCAVAAIIRWEPVLYEEQPEYAVLFRRGNREIVLFEAASQRCSGRVCLTGRGEGSRVCRWTERCMCGDQARSPVGDSCDQQAG